MCFVEIFCIKRIKMDNLVEKFSSSDFNSEKYVKELSQRCVGGQELQQQRKIIQSLFESTNVLLKKNVYRNYMQFIETAKEITHLESEMYQLSHLLTEQKLLLEVLANSDNLEDSSVAELHDEVDKQKEKSDKQKQKQEEDRIRILTSIAEKVEGCTGLLEIKERLLLHEGDLIELDPVENNVTHKTHAYLFSDSLMLTSWITNRRGPVRYKMYAMYNLNSMAVVNVRDATPVEKAFKILAYPDTRLFQCSSMETKKEWLECFEQAKKAKIAREKEKREADIIQSNDELCIRNSTLDSPTNYFEDESIFSNSDTPEWFLESPEEIDVLIAERHFEDALQLLIRSKNFIEGLNTNELESGFLDIKDKIEGRRKNLITVLVKELEVSSEKSLQGGLRAARRAVRLLISLDKETQACDLMLKLCTSIVKKELKRVKREGATSLYVKQLADIFYSTLKDVVKEFQKVFSNSPACSAALVVWSNSEFSHFMAHVIKQVFVPQSSITIVGECISYLRLQNSQLNEFGLDLCYQMEGMLQKPVCVTLQDAKEKLIEAIKHRSSEEKWHPTNFHSKNNLNNLIQEFHDLGLSIGHFYTKGDCWIELTSSTIAFTKSYMTLFGDCLKLYSPQLHFIIEDVLHDIFLTQLKLFQNSAGNPKQEVDAQQIEKNLMFLSDSLLKTIERDFEKHFLVSSGKLKFLISEFKQLKHDIFKPKPSPRSITKYTSEEFF